MNKPEIITRKMWSGKSFVPWRTGSLKCPVVNLYFTVTATEMCFTQSSCTQVIMLIKEIELRCRERKGNDPDIPYNFMIGGDGCVYEGRGWRTWPRLPKMYSKSKTTSLLIAFMGGFKRTPPSFKMFDARDSLVQYGIEKGYISNEYIPTDIP